MSNKTEYIGIVCRCTAPMTAINLKHHNKSSFTSKCKQSTDNINMINNKELFLVIASACFDTAGTLLSFISEFVVLYDLLSLLTQISANSRSAYIFFYTVFVDNHINFLLLYQKNGMPNKFIDSVFIIHSCYSQTFVFLSPQYFCSLL